MAYNENIPVLSNDLATDVPGMNENFSWLRRHFLNGVIPINDSDINYTYDANGNVTNGNIEIGGVEVATFTYTYDGNGNVINEDWTVDGVTYAIVYTYSSGNMINTHIAIT